MVFRATRKSILKVIWATRKSMPQFQRPIFWKLGMWAKFPHLTWKNKNSTLINVVIESIFWNTNISCHDTFKGCLYVFLAVEKKPEYNLFLLKSLWGQTWFFYLEKHCSSQQSNWSWNIKKEHKNKLQKWNKKVSFPILHCP